MMPAVARRLPDGKRLHLQHGPMDVIVEVTGSRQAVAEAETAAIVRFEGILDELVPQLPSLRSPMGQGDEPVGTIAQRMVDAASRFPGVFLTPMVCVAGSIADELRSLIAEVAGVERAYVNNGGDVSLHLGPGSSLRVGFVPSLETGRHEFALEVDSSSSIRGLATSGWGGRSFSFGIADAVTVVATTTAVADVAASLVANAVDLPGHPAIERTPAHELDPDSDLRDRLVTTGVGALGADEVDAALARGAAAAERYLAQEQELLGAVLVLRGRRRVVGGAVAAVEPAREVAHGR
jgi:ApbE superfamily uncharacterized protein (UPF0280 family)